MGNQIDGFKVKCIFRQQRKNVSGHILRARISEINSRIALSYIRFQISYFWTYYNRLYITLVSWAKKQPGYILQANCMQYPLGYKEYVLVHLMKEVL